MTNDTIDLLTERLASVLAATSIPFDVVMLRQYVSSSLGSAVTLGFDDAEQVLQLFELPFLVRRHGDACEFLQLAVGAVMMRQERSPEKRLEFIHDHVLTRPARAVDASALNLLRAIARPSESHE